MENEPPLQPLLDAYPLPWEHEGYPHRAAHIYAADSSHVVRLTGPRAGELAAFIVNTVNQAHVQGGPENEQTPTQVYKS